MTKPPLQKMKLSLTEIVHVTGESSPTIRAAVAAGHLDSFLVGRRRFALPAAVAAWVRFLETQSRAGRPVCYRARNADLSELKALRKPSSPPGDVVIDP